MHSSRKIGQVSGLVIEEFRVIGKYIYSYFFFMRLDFATLMKKNIRIYKYVGTKLTAVYSLDYYF